MCITDVPGIIAGHATNENHRTGCTAVLCPDGAVGGVDVVGFATGTRETELLRPVGMVERVHGILLGGGSAFGLAAASGMMRWLYENGHGFDTGIVKVPLVPGAVIFDLLFNQSAGLPDEAMGYEAAQNAGPGPLAQGNVGAGTGATAGKAAGFERAMKTGLGSASMTVGDIVVGAVTAVNPFGDVVDPETGATLAGVRSEKGDRIQGVRSVLPGMQQAFNGEARSNTVISVVATNADLNKVQVNRLAHMAAAGLARTIRPVHTLFDGDVVFALATGRGPVADENLVGALGAETLARAVAAGAREAEGIPGFPAYQDLS